MAIETRSRGKLPTPGPFLAEVTNLLDPTYMGSLEVALIKGIPNSIVSQGETYIVRYLSPFYGVTSLRFEGNNAGDFNDVQKSYGMWMVPPDVGTTVMVIFVDGDPNQGYWMGCVPDVFQNHMVPGIAASKQTILTPEQERKYGTTYLPVAEYNKSTQKLENTNIERLGKPVHPFADRLLAQGLLLDTVRGVTSSSARREVPSSVFGVSTPGPVDTSVGAKRGEIGYDRKVRIPVSRLGGSTFVMDDGDVNGQNELVRIRTRTGHQILLHNSHDLVYIANSKGTAWIELTSNGKIDIYAHDSISVHSEQDFNFRADRDINLEAGRNINVNADGGIDINTRERFNLICNNDGKLTFCGDLNVTAIADIRAQASGTMNLSSEGSLRVNTGSDLSLGASGKILQSGSEIHLNGPAAEAATAPEQPELIPRFSLPNRSPNSGWTNGNFYKSSNITSIMQRVPTHEPWDQHENVNPSKFSPSNTSAGVRPTEIASNGTVIPQSQETANDVEPKVGPAEDKGKVFGKPYSWSTDQPFLTKVKEVAGRLKFDPIDLLAIMNLESARTFDPSITNSLGYTGLIQFGGAAASSLGTTTENLRRMNRVEQMEWVYKYFNKLWGWPNSKCSNPTLVNLYLTVLLPAFRFAAPDEKIADGSDPKTAKWYLANSGFDPSPKKGYFTPSMVEKTVMLHRREVQQCLSKAGVSADLIVPPQPNTVTSGSGGIVSDSSGNPIKTGG